LSLAEHRGCGFSAPVGRLDEAIRKHEYSPTRPTHRGVRTGGTGHRCAVFPGSLRLARLYGRQPRTREPTRASDGHRLRHQTLRLFQTDSNGKVATAPLGVDATVPCFPAREGFIRSSTRRYVRISVSLSHTVRRNACQAPYRDRKHSVASHGYSSIEYLLIFEQYQRYCHCTVWCGRERKRCEFLSTCPLTARVAATALTPTSSSAPPAP
jgi:hypothetical protein